MSYHTDVDLSANEKVGAWLLAKYRDEGTGWRPSDSLVHLHACPEATVTHPEGSDSVYGCDTGCEYVRLECTITCPHGHSQSYEYGEFGELAYMLEEIDPSIKLD